VTTPPAGLSGYVQTLAARLLGHEGELTHCAACETVERCCHRDTKHCSPGNQEKKGQRMWQHAGNDGKTVRGLNFTNSVLLSVHLEYVMIVCEETDTESF